MNGIDFLRGTRAAGNNVPFGFVTSEGTAAMRSAATEAGASFVGAALAMIPPAVLAESTSAEKPSDALRENAYEVFNIAASFFNEVDETDVTAPDYPVGKLALLAPRHGIGPRPSGRS